MLKIRLTRKGKKSKAFFRLVVAEHTAPIKGRFLEALGYFNPHTKEKNIKADRVKFWIEKGAQCSDTVHNLLIKEGILKGSKRAIKVKKKEEKKPGEKTEKTGEAKSAEGEEKPAKIETKPEEKAEEKEPEKVSKESAEPEKKEKEKPEKEAQKDI